MKQNNNNNNKKRTPITLEDSRGVIVAYGNLYRDGNIQILWRKDKGYVGEQYASIAPLFDLLPDIKSIKQHDEDTDIEFEKVVSNSFSEEGNLFIKYDTDNEEGFPVSREKPTDTDSYVAATYDSLNQRITLNMEDHRILMQQLVRKKVYK